jgi:RsiW-degrading membrane proteinase PrsW (M82 family)
LATIPGLVISYVIFRVDKYEREPFLPLLICYALGALMTIPAVELEKWVFGVIDLQHKDFISVFLLSFVAIATNEELLKFLVLAAFAYRSRYFDEPMDGIVYAVLIAMGFATMENITYAERFGAQTVLLRSFTAVPAHLVFAIVQGYYAGIARFKSTLRYKILGRGLLISILLHGAYDFLIFQDWSDWLFVGATLSLYLCLYYSSRLIKAHLDNSPFR